MKIYSTIIFIFLLLQLNGQALPDRLKNEVEISLTTASGNIMGSLLIPDGKQPVPIALIIAGSGPTDRNGNNKMMPNNSLKFLAQGLLNNNIASVRYDKRGIGESMKAGTKEEDLRFDTYVDDAVAWIRLLTADKRFSKVIIIGHSEGSLIGTVAAQRGKGDAFISIAGAGQSADKIIKAQLKEQPKAVLDMVNPIIDSLVKGKLVSDVNPMLNSLFRPSVQPYMISWFAYNPQQEIGKLSIPVLILQGTQDLQVTVEDAKALAASNKKAKLVLVEGMNHIFKEVEEDRQKNIATYSNPDLPVMPQLINECVTFIKNIK